MKTLTDIASEKDNNPNVPEFLPDAEIWEVPRETTDAVVVVQSLLASQPLEAFGKGAAMGIAHGGLKAR